MNSNRFFQTVVVLSMFLFVQTATIGQAPAIEKEKINFTDFKINSIKNRIAIHWKTDDGVSANYFEIERSSNGINFKTIAMVLGPDPKQVNCNCYEGFDKPDSKSKKYYYRLKHVSIDGEIELSKTKMLAIN